MIIFLSGSYFLHFYFIWDFKWFVLPDFSFSKSWMGTWGIKSMVKSTLDLCQIWLKWNKIIFNYFSLATEPLNFIRQHAKLLGRSTRCLISLMDNSAKSIIQGTICDNTLLFGWCIGLGTFDVVWTFGDSGCWWSSPNATFTLPWFSR